MSWTGKGLSVLLSLILAVVIAFAGMFLMLKLGLWQGTGRAGRWFTALIFALAAFFNWLFSHGIQAFRDKPKEYYKDEAGRDLVVDHTSEFMNLPRKYYTYIFAGVGLLMFVLGIFKS